MQMVCIISCNNPTQAAPRRLNSSNRASAQAHSQRPARAGCCGRQRLTSPHPPWGSALEPSPPRQPGSGEPPASSGRCLGVQVIFAAGGGYVPMPAAITASHTAPAPRSLPGDAEEGRAQPETPPSHLQTSLINDGDRETQAGAGGIDTGWRTLRAAEPRGIPGQNGRSPRARSRDRGKTG